MLFSIVNDPVISANELNHDLKVINRWAYQQKMELNPDPNKQATELFSRKKDSPNHPSLFCNGNVVPKVNEQKHLGFILVSKLSCERHLNEKIIKAKNIGIIKYLSKFLPIKTIYHIPALNSQSNSGVTLNTLMGKVERTQYQTALVMGWESLSDRRWCRRIFQIHKIENKTRVVESGTKITPICQGTNKSSFLNENQCRD